MVLRLFSVSERRSQPPLSCHPLIKHHDRLSFICRPGPHAARSPLLQKGVKLPLDVVEGVFAHVVHLARFPALLPLLRGDLRRGRRSGSRGEGRLLRGVLVELILRDRVSE